MSIIARTESEYLIISNRKRCAEILSRKNKLPENDIIDAFISLHLVLEVGLNTFYRHLFLLGIRKDVNGIEVIKNLDDVSFIDKTIMFIYTEHFHMDSQRDVDELTRHHSILGEMRRFSEMRNKLLHGHSISTIFKGENSHHTKLRKNITMDGLNAQIDSFKRIMKGMRAYVDRLSSALTTEGKETLKQAYLSSDFLPIP